MHYLKNNNQHRKLEAKPWIIPALQKFISIKNNLLKKFIIQKDSQTKEKFHKKYKDCRNLLSTILKKRAK